MEILVDDNPYFGPHPQGNYFLFIEMTSQLHRSLVPIQVWLLYLLHGGLALSSSVSAAPDAPKDDSSSNYYVTAYVSTFMGIVLMVAYILVKGKLIWAQLGSWRVAASKLWQCTVSRGSTLKSCFSKRIKPNRRY